MAEAKTQPQALSFEQWLTTIADPDCVKQCQELALIMQQLSGYPPTVWGNKIIGFGQYHYTYASGRTGVWPRIAFAPRKKEITLYLADEFAERDALLQQLGKLKLGKSCVYLKNLAQTDTAVLHALISASLNETARRYPEKV